MKKAHTHFMGVDVSKLTLDIVLIVNGDRENSIYKQFKNTPHELKSIRPWLHELGVTLTELLVCMEYTGIYNRPILHFLTELKVDIWLEMPVAIIRSMGLQRGKNDKVDAKRIAMYAYTHREKVRLWKPASENMQRLKNLISLRQRLIKTAVSLSAPIKELRAMHEAKEAKELQNFCKKTIENSKQELKAVDKKIKQIIATDSSLQKNYKLLQTVPGIGPITALELICYTNNFEYMANPKQLACYSGCAPFEHRSGTSIRGKTRVSNMANKALKTTLTMCAWSVIRKNGFLNPYYNRKLKEGKSKMSVINAVRNKLLQFASAVIREQEIFKRDYIHPLAA